MLHLAKKMLYGTVMLLYRFFKFSFLFSLCPYMWFFELKLLVQSVLIETRQRLINAFHLVNPATSSLDNARRIRHSHLLRLMNFFLWKWATNLSRIGRSHATNPDRNTWLTLVKANHQDETKDCQRTIPSSLNGLEVGLVFETLLNWV